MPLVLEEADLDKDYEELFEAEWAAWTNPPQVMWSLMFPAQGTGPEAVQAAKQVAADRQLRFSRMDPHDRWVKVTDAETGTIVAGALWKFYASNPYRAPLPQLDAFWWPKGHEMRKLANDMYHQLQVTRPKIVSTAHAYLYNIFTHPDHRHRGAAALCVDWGIKIADERGIEAYVEGTKYGRALYEKHGFVTMELTSWKFDSPNPSAEWKRMVHELTENPCAVMWRPIGGQYEKGKTVIPWEGKPRDG